MADRSPFETKLRALIAQVVEKPAAEIMTLPRATPLLGEGLALDSFSGMQLLSAIQAEFAIDVAAEDLNLDSLETIGTLSDFLQAHNDSAS